jgi:hypothetical protein
MKTKSGRALLVGHKISQCVRPRHLRNEVLSNSLLARFRGNLLTLTTLCGGKQSTF